MLQHVLSVKGWREGEGGEENEGGGGRRRRKGEEGGEKEKGEREGVGEEMRERSELVME